MGYLCVCIGYWSAIVIWAEAVLEYFVPVRRPPSTEEVACGGKSSQSRPQLSRNSLDFRFLLGSLEYRSPRHAKLAAGHNCVES